MALAQNPELATEVTLQPLARFPLDAAILFSDILTIPDAMGLGLVVRRRRGPAIRAPDARRGRDPRARACRTWQRSRYVFEAVAQIKRALDGRVPLIGFAGSPFTLACYMIEGGGSADFATVRRMAYARPDLLAHLVASTRARSPPTSTSRSTRGADAVMIFDTWGGLLSTRRLPRASRSRRCAT